MNKLHSLGYPVQYWYNKYRIKIFNFYKCFHLHTDPTLLTFTSHGSPYHFPSLTGQISHYSNRESPVSTTRLHLTYIPCSECWKIPILKWPTAALTDICQFQRLGVEGVTLYYHKSSLLKVHVRLSTHLHFSLYHRKVSLQSKNFITTHQELEFVNNTANIL